jgi:hypothetical protein
LKVSKKITEKLILKQDTAAGFMVETMNVTWCTEHQVDISRKREDVLTIILKPYRYYEMPA